MKARRIVITIGGLALAFRIREKRIFEAIQRRYTGYVSSSGKAVVEFDCRFGGTSDFGDDKAIVRCDDTGELHARRKDFYAQWHRGVGKLTAQRSIFTFDGFLRVLVATSGLNHKRLFLHSCGLARYDRAVVCAGVSGSGKSTASRSCKTADVLNDEIVCVDASGDQPMVWGTPFWGEMGTGPAFAKPYELAALCFLRKCQSGWKSSPLQPDKAVSLFLKCCCLFGEDQGQAQDALSLAVSLLQKVPSYELSFSLQTCFDTVVAELS